MSQKPILFTSTFYCEVTEVRCQLAFKTMKRAAEAGYTLVVVDGSPDDVGNAMQLEAVKHGIKLFPELERGMGPSRRQACFHALEEARRQGAQSIVWMEPEKDDFIRSLPLVGTALGEYDLVVAGRNPGVMDTYPLFQQETEAEAIRIFNEAAGTCGFDPFFGPVGFTRRSAHFLLEYDPLVDGLDDTYVCHYAVCLAIRQGCDVVPVNVDFVYPPEQRAEEEEDDAMRKKRTEQKDKISAAYRRLLEGPRF